MDLERAFTIFDLNADSPPEVIRKRYHELAAVWHPDRHTGSSRLSELAADKMKQINLAHETIRAHLSDFTSIACPHCGAHNRRRKDLNLDYAACSACARPLKRPVPAGRRTPCGNRRCAGTIGSNGRCLYCGKTFEEGRAAAAMIVEPSVGRLHTRRPAVTRRRTGVWGLALVACAWLTILAYSHRHVILPGGSSLGGTKVSGGAATASEPPPHPQQAAAFKSASPPAAGGLSHFRNLLRKPEVTSAHLIQMQGIFRVLGYDIQAPDGVAGEPTVSCLFQYSRDFGYTPGPGFPECFFKHAAHHYLVSSEHGDWREIHTTGALDRWIGSLPDADRRRLLELPLDRPGVLIQLIRRYKFTTSKPVPQPAPESGVIRKATADGSCTLRLRTESGANDYFVKLMDALTGREAGAAYVRSGTTLEVRVPAGAYLLTYAAGRNWYGPECLFGTSGSYGRYPGPLAVASDSKKVNALTVDLVPSRHGRLVMEPISEFDF